MSMRNRIQTISNGKVHIRTSHRLRCSVLAVGEVMIYTMNLRYTYYGKASFSRWLPLLFIMKCVLLVL